LAVSSREGEKSIVIDWDLETDMISLVHEDEVTQQWLAYTPDGRFLFFGSPHQIWSVADQKLVEIPTDWNRMSVLAISPGATFVCTAGGYLWKMDSILKER